MSKEELKLGNYVQVVYYPSDMVCRVTEINKSIIDSSYSIGVLTDDNLKSNIALPDIEGISLTESWLEKLGFSECEEFLSEEHPWSDYVKDGVRIGLPYFSFTYNHGDSEIYINEVHKLQNLYNSLTGELLEIE